MCSYLRSIVEKKERRTERKDALKGQCHEIFDIFFLQKPPPEPHMNWQKWVCDIFFFCENIREKTCVRVVIGYADTQ